MNPARIQVEHGPVFEVAADEDSLLRGALRAGFDFPYECSVGGCGGCRFELLDGAMTTLWPQAPGLPEREPTAVLSLVELRGGARTGATVVGGGHRPLIFLFSIRRPIKGLEVLHFIRSTG